MICSAPTLETERLLLRQYDREDLDAYAAMMADLEIVRHLGGQPMSREDSWRKLMMVLGQWAILGYGYWAVELKASGRTVGQLGFCDFNRSMTPDISGQPEMGWIFDRSVQGQGIAFEAGKRALDWVQAELGPVDVPAIIALENIPSIKLAERLGFVRHPNGIYHDEPIGIFRRPASA